MRTVDEEMAREVPYEQLRQHAVNAGRARRKRRRRRQAVTAVVVAVVLLVLLWNTAAVVAPALALAAAVWAVPRLPARAPAWRVVTGLALLSPLVVGAIVLAPRLRGDTSRKIVVGPAASSAYRGADDFSNPMSGWDVTDGDKGSITYLSGGYQLVIRQPARGTFASRRWDALPPSVRLEVDAIKASPALGSFGLACRDDGGRRYEGRVDVNGTWKIAKAGKDIVTGNTDAIRPTEVNRIALECQGGDGNHGPVMVTLFVNGVNLGQLADDDGLAPGGVGVVLASNTGAVEVLFDNFAVLGL